LRESRSRKQILAMVNWRNYLSRELTKWRNHLCDIRVGVWGNCVRAVRDDARGCLINPIVDDRVGGPGAVEVDPGATAEIQQRIRFNVIATPADDDTR
jgi:hypothetical protein